MTGFAGPLAAQYAIHDAFFGEGFTVAGPAAVDPADPQRRQPLAAPTPFTGIWTEAAGAFRAHNAEGHAENATRRISADRATVEFTAAAVPFPVLKSFVVTRLADGTLYTVAEVVPDDGGRTVLVLTAKTKGTP